VLPLNCETDGAVNTERELVSHEKALKKSRNAAQGETSSATKSLGFLERITTGLQESRKEWKHGTSRAVNNSRIK